MTGFEISVRQKIIQEKLQLMKTSLNFTNISELGEDLGKVTTAIIHNVNQNEMKPYIKIHKKLIELYNQLFEFTKPQTKLKPTMRA